MKEAVEVNVRGTITFSFEITETGETSELPDDIKQKLLDDTTKYLEEEFGKIEIEGARMGIRIREVE